jgi:hypothetical protein
VFRYSFLHDAYVVRFAGPQQGPTIYLDRRRGDDRRERGARERRVRRAWFERRMRRWDRRVGWDRQALA